MHKKVFIIFYYLAIIFCLVGCSNPDISFTSNTETTLPSGYKVNTTKEAVQYFTDGVKDLDDTISLYVETDNINADEITNAISRKINFAKKDYDICNIKGCSMKTYRSDEYSEITISVKYYMSLEQKQYVDSEVKKISEHLKGKTDAETYQNIFEWICANVEYDYDTAEGLENRFSAYDALKHRKAVCYGYAALYQKFCDELGLECIVLTSMDNTAHAWNVVKIKNQYYHVDTTFGAGDNANGNILWEYCLAGQDRIQYGNAYGIQLAKKSYKLDN